MQVDEPGNFSPIATEASQVCQNIFNGKEYNLTESLFKVGTGYLGNGLGKLGEGTSDLHLLMKVYNLFIIIYNLK